MDITAIKTALAEDKAAEERFSKIKNAVEDGTFAFEIEELAGLTVEQREQLLLAESRRTKAAITGRRARNGPTRRPTRRQPMGTRARRSGSWTTTNSVP